MEGQARPRQTVPRPAASMRPRRGTPWKVSIPLCRKRTRLFASMRPRRGTPWKDFNHNFSLIYYSRFNAATEGNSVEGTPTATLERGNGGFNAATEGNSVEGWWRRSRQAMCWWPSFNAATEGNSVEGVGLVSVGQTHSCEAVCERVVLSKSFILCFHHSPATTPCQA